MLPASAIHRLQETAAAGITLTTPPDEVSAAATVVALEPFLDATLLAAVQEGKLDGCGARDEEAVAAMLRCKCQVH